MPRVLLANSNLVPHWANWDHFHEPIAGPDDVRPDDGRQLDLHRQGIVQGTYETFFSVANQHFNGDPSGRWILTGGLGGGRRAAAGATMAASR